MDTTNKFLEKPSQMTSPQDAMSIIYNKLYDMHPDGLEFNSQTHRLTIRIDNRTVIYLSPYPGNSSHLQLHIAQDIFGLIYLGEESLKIAKDVEKREVLKKIITKIVGEVPVDYIDKLTIQDVDIQIKEYVNDYKPPVKGLLETITPVLKEIENIGLKVAVITANDAIKRITERVATKNNIQNFDYFSGRRVLFDSLKRKFSLLRKKLSS